MSLDDIFPEEFSTRLFTLFKDALAHQGERHERGLPTADPTDVLLEFITGLVSSYGAIIPVKVREQRLLELTLRIAENIRRINDGLDNRPDIGIEFRRNCYGEG